MDEERAGLDAAIPLARARRCSRKSRCRSGAANLNDINFDDIYYFLRATDRSERSWEEVPEDIKKTFDRLGIPEAEKKFLAGVGAQYESEVVYHNIQEHCTSRA